MWQLKLNPPTLEEVQANLRAGVKHAGRRDVPDILAWRDFSNAPELVLKRLWARLENGRCPALVDSFPYPKMGKSENRKITWLDVYGDLYYRIITGRLAAFIDSALSADVMSFRLENNYPSWTYHNQSEAFSRREQRGLKLLNDDSCEALLITDIRNYYPSVIPEHLVEVLRNIEAPNEKINSIEHFLRQLTTLGAPKGLPIGPEASGLLGNIAMLPVDRAITPLVTAHVRYTDDSWLFLRSLDDKHVVLEQYRTAAYGCGLKINEEKIQTCLKADGSAQEEIRYRAIDYLKFDNAGFCSPDTAAAIFRYQLSSGEPDLRLCRFLLGVFRHHRHSGALDSIYEHPEIMSELPSQVGNYLCSLVDKKESCRKLDRDWLIQCATSSKTPRELAGRLQVCRVASQIKLSKTHGKHMEEIATDRDRYRHVPLGMWAAMAWGSSDAHTPGQAVEYACEFGDFSMRRAFAATISPNTSTPSKRTKWYHKLIAADPDLLPVAARLS